MSQQPIPCGAGRKAGFHTGSSLLLWRVSIVWLSRAGEPGTPEPALRSRSRDPGVHNLSGALRRSAEGVRLDSLP